MDQIKATIKSYILDEFLPGEDPAHLQDSTPLITSAVLDSLATLRLVAFLEQQFRVKIHAHEASVDHLNTLSEIAELVNSKLAAAPTA